MVTFKVKVGLFDNRREDILILGKGTTQGLEKTTLTADKE